jgi:hypothetical protein
LDHTLRVPIGGVKAAYGGGMSTIRQKAASDGERVTLGRFLRRGLARKIVNRKNDHGKRVARQRADARIR